MRSGTVAVYYRGNDSVGELASKSTDQFVFFFVSGFSPSARASHGDKKKEKKNTLNIALFPMINMLNEDAAIVDRGKNHDSQKK